MLGVILGCRWHFREHFGEVQKKATKRLQIVRRVSGTIWGMESRILAISTHAPIESVVNYGLAVTGNHVGQQALDKIDKSVLNIAAREIVGTNISAKREVLYALAAIKTTHNHFIVKTANMLDRVLRAPNTAAQKNAWTFIETLSTKVNREGKEASERKWLTLWTPTEHTMQEEQDDSK